MIQFSERYLKLGVHTILFFFFSMPNCSYPLLTYCIGVLLLNQSANVTNLLFYSSVNCSLNSLYSAQTDVYNKCMPVR